MADPNNSSSLYAKINPNTDALQIRDSSGEIVGWIDNQGELQGSLDSEGNASQLQGNPVSSTAPQDNQTLVWNGALQQWVPGSGAAPLNYNIAYSTDYNWSLSYQSGWGALSAGQRATLTLAICPNGVDASGSPNLGGPQGGYSIYISGSGTAEAVKITGGTCTPSAINGTIVFTSFYDHSAGYSLSSATSGIQEAINTACGTSSASPNKNSGCKIILPPVGNEIATQKGYDIYDTIYFHTNRSLLSGYGATLNCRGRGPCLQIGDLLNSNHYANNTIEGISFRAPTNLTADPAFNGSLITQTVRDTNISTITTSAAHNLRTGDMVTQMFTDHVNYWGDVPSITVVDDVTYTYPRSGAAPVDSQTTPGVTALTYVAILDNANSSHFKDIQTASASGGGRFNHFFDLWDDENCIIERYNNNAISVNNSANWSGSYVFSGGARNLPSTSQQLAPVITVRETNMTANYANGITVYNNNGLYVFNTVIQASGPWQVFSSNSTGNYQGASLFNIYSESSQSLNPLSPIHSPWAGCGIAGLIAGPSTGAASFQISGNGQVGGTIPSYGSGTSTYVYYIIAKDTTNSTQTSPLPAMIWEDSGSGTPTVMWPRIANGADTITYDIIRTTAPQGMGAVAGGFVAPYTGGCPGGSAATCGSVAIGQAQCSGFVCTFVDDTTVNTAAYNTIPKGDFSGAFTFWPGAIVTSNTPVLVENENTVVGVGMQGQPVQVAKYCGKSGLSTSGGYTVCIGSKLSTNNAVKNQTATFLQDGGASGGMTSGSKGRLNFITSPNVTMSAHHIITLVDSNPSKTGSTTTYRPPADSSDTYIGLDGSGALNAGKLAFGSPISISNYIGNTGDGSSYLERLTSSLKSFAVPIQLASSTFSALGSPANGTMIYCSDCTTTNPCVGNGSGAFAKRINGSWVCS